MKSIFTFKNYKRYLKLISLSLCSFILAFTVLELSLSYAGRIYKEKFRNDAQVRESIGSKRAYKDQIVILSLGDSFTFGGEGLPNNSYPAFLDRIIKKKNINSSVLNHGICESTSRFVLDNFATELSFTNPDVVLLLTGASDLFAPYPNADKIETLYEKSDFFIKKTHVFKLFRHIYFELSERYYKWKLKSEIISNETAFVSETVDKDFKSYIIDAYNQVATLDQSDLQKKINGWQQDKNLDLKNRISLGFAFIMTGNYDKSLTTFEELIYSGSSLKWRKALKTQLTNTGLAHSIFPLLDRTQLLSDNQKEEMNLLALRIGLTDSNTSLLEGIIRLYERNSNLNPQHAIDAINYSINKDPTSAHGTLITSARLILQDFKLWRQNVGIWYEENLRRIIQISSKKNIFLVLQTYPIQYNPINEIVRKLANEYNLPLVDHEKIFAPLIKKDMRKYVLNDTHCSPLGHELMAKNIINVLNKTALKDKDSIWRLENNNAKYWQIRKERK